MSDIRNSQAKFEGYKSTTTIPSERSANKMKKKKKRLTAFSIENRSVEVIKKTSFNMAGVATLILSTISQKVIGCSVGDNVSAENPWTYVNKEKIEDNIELHEESSEFLGLANEIKLYPEPKILIGWIPAASEKHDEFYVVYTLEAKEEVLKIIERKKKEMDEKLQRQVRRKVGKWKSLGSETEVDESLIKNFRPLYEVEITSKFPLYTQSVTFKMRTVEDTRDGYVELLQDVRCPIENIERKRVDIAVQAAIAKVTREIQTNPTYPINIGTQYEFPHDVKNSEYVEQKIRSSRAQTNVQINLHNVQDVTENLFLNEHVNIFKDDYAALSLKERQVNVSGHFQRFLSCSDPSSSQGKPISDCAWSCFYSGIIAVCYTDYSVTSVIRKYEETDYYCNAGVSSTIPPPPVLIWSYTDGLEPKLYLQSPRQVTYLSWCPYEKDILVGGLINGQIIVWDLTNKLQEVETPEILTMTQKRNRLNLLSLMKWVKHTNNPAIVEPAIVSNLSYSHKACVSHIRWLPYCCEITRNGKYRCTEGVIKKQFSTMSEDGNILLWDLNITTLEKLPKTGARKLKRIKKIPSALISKETNLKELGKDFKPHYKITLKELPILTPLRSTSFTRYDPIDSYVDPRPQIRTTYTFPLNQEFPNEYKKFIFATGLGHMFEAKIEGYDFDLGTTISTEEAIIDHYGSIHDGPLTFIGEHPSLNEYILSIGGCIFTIWHKENKQALFWRKAKSGIKYLTGGWILARAACILLIRSDGAFEYWDFLINNVKPTRMIVTGGDMILKLHGFLTSRHASKDTFAFNDNLGTLVIYLLPELFKIRSDDEKSMMKNLLDRSNERQKILQKWITNFLENYIVTPQEHKLQIDSMFNTETNKLHRENKIHKEDSKLFSQIEKMNRIFDSAQWSSKEEKERFQTMLDRKRLNLQELEMYKDSLLQEESQRKEKLFKQNNILKHRNTIFIQESQKIFNRREHLISQRKYSDQLSDGTDFTFVDDFEKIQKGALYFIENHPFKHSFEWSKLMRKGNNVNKHIQNWLKTKSMLGNIKTRTRIQQPLVL